MTKKLISFLIALCIFIAIPLSARYKYNPFTRKLDYYETGADIDLGDLADVTLTGLATGNIFYYNGTAWVNLTTGANTNVLTLAGGIPSWAAPGAPAAHAATHLAAGADSVDHDLLLNYFIYNHVGEDHIVDHNIWVGWLAGQDLAVGGQYNTLVGEQAGTDVTTGDYNTMVGYRAGLLQTVATGSTFVGYLAGSATVDGLRNTAIGFQAFIGGAVDGDTADNVAVGAEALFSLGEASAYNVAVGNFALHDIADEASRNTAVGHNAGYDTGGDAADNVYIGYSVGYGTGASASENTGVGSQAIQFLTGQGNVAVGFKAGQAMTSGRDNVILGNQAAEDITTGSLNVVIGFMAGEGWLDDEGEKLVIDVTDTATPLIYGDFSADNITINGDFSVTMDAALDQIAITQIDTTGTDGFPLIIINDDRTGAYADSVNEATLRIDAAGVYALYVENGEGRFAGNVKIDGDTQVAGYRRVDTVYWIDCFDHGTVANKYQWDWDIDSLSTQGNGTNTVDTTPSEITLTTDANGVGDNEGTRTEFAIIQRARQNRSEFEIELGQTANTQFYCGWNTSGTNAMVAAADEYVIVFFDVSDNPNWQIKVGDGTTEDVYPSGRVADTNHIIHEIWVETDGTVHWAINGTELDITGSVDNLMTANDHYLIVGQAQSVTGVAAIVVEIDYVENEKTKTH